MNAPFSADALSRLRDEYARAPRKLFIANEFVDAAGGETFDVIDPATGEAFAAAASGGAEDIDRAVRAARAAFPPGPRLRRRRAPTCC
jgi:acyl-CoA reductase-like NAD-dependent aldehyde dehydrogenase